MVSKLGDTGDLPTTETTVCRGNIIYTEEVIDWRRVTKDPETGEEIILDESEI